MDISVITLLSNEKPTKTNSKDSDQPEHQPSLIRVVAVHLKKQWLLSYLLSVQLESYQTRRMAKQARGYKTFFVLNSTEHEISTAHKN